MEKGCLKIGKLLDLYINNELSQDQMRLVSNHVSNCKDCSMELNSIQRLRGLIKAVAVEEVKLPDFVWAQYWHGVEAKIPKKRQSIITELLERLFTSHAMAFSMGAIMALLLVTFVGVMFMINKEKSSKILMTTPYMQTSCVVKSIKSVNPNSSVMVLPNTKKDQMTIIWVFGLNNQKNEAKEEDSKCRQGENMLM